MAITIVPPKIRRKVPGAAILRGLYQKVQTSQGKDRVDAINKLADVTGMSARAIETLSPKEMDRFFREVQYAGDSGIRQTNTQTLYAQTIPQKLDEPTTMGAVRHALKTPAVDVEKIITPTGDKRGGVLNTNTATNLDALRTSYGDDGVEAILSKMADRQASGAGGEIMQTNLNNPVFIDADPHMIPRGTSDPVTDAITYKTNYVGEMMRQGPRRKAEAESVIQEEFAHNVAGSMGPRRTTPFWKQAQEKGFVRPNPDKPDLWQQMGVAGASDAEYGQNAEEARAKLVTVARQMGVHPDMLKGGFDEWLRRAEREGARAVGDPALTNHVIGPMLKRDARGNFTPEAKRAQEWGRLVFQNWATNQGTEEPSVRASDTQYFIDGLT